jgi:hypothetical protein
MMIVVTEFPLAAFQRGNGTPKPDRLEGIALVVEQGAEFPVSLLAVSRKGPKPT